MSRKRQFVKLGPEDIYNFFRYDDDYKCFVKLPKKIISEDKFLEFWIQIDMFTFTYTGHSINNPVDIKDYWYIDHNDENYFKDLEDSKEPWTWCPCGKHIADPRYITLKSNINIRLRVGSSCVHKCATNNENLSDEENEEMPDDEINNPLTHSLRKILNERNRRKNYIIAKREGRLCKVCDKNCLNMSIKCCRDEKTCVPCFISSKLLNDIINNVHKEIFKKEQTLWEVQKFSREFTRRCIFNVLELNRQESIDLENSFKYEQNKDTNFENHVIPQCNIKMTLLEIYNSKGGIDYLLKLFENREFKKFHPGALSCIEVFLRSRVKIDKTNRDLICKKFNIKLKVKIDIKDYVMPIGRYQGKTLDYIFNFLDNADYLIKLSTNEEISQEIRNNVILFLEQN